METKPLKLGRRTRRCLWLLLLAYPVCLLLLGPYHALQGRGYLDFAPEKLRMICYLPSAPFYLIAGPDNPYDDYLNWWYDDPNAADTTW